MLYTIGSKDRLSAKHLTQKLQFPSELHFPVIYENRIFMVYEFGNIRHGAVLSMHIAPIFARCVTTSDAIAKHLDHVSSRNCIESDNE